MSAYRGEAEWVDLDTERCDVLLFELASQMALDEGRLRCPVSAYDAKVVSAAAQLTLPVPPSPTSTSLKVGVPEASAMVVRVRECRVRKSWMRLWWKS